MKYTRGSVNFSKIQSGSIMIFALVSMVILIILVHTYFTTSTAVSNKMRLANAADAAALAVGTWASRHLNFIAYTNRAMAANHIAAGHMVAYTSWVRYANKQVKNVNKIAKYVPYIGPISQTVATVYKNNKLVTESVIAPTYLTELSVLNQAIYAAQIASKSEAIVKGLADLAEHTVKQFDPGFQINSAEIISGLPSEFKLIGAQALMSQYTSLYNFTNTMTTDDAPKTEHHWFAPGENGCRNYHRNVGCTVGVSSMYALVSASLDESPSYSWLKKRSSTTSFTEFVKLKKRSQTEMNVNLKDWQQLDYMYLSVVGKDSASLGSANASSSKIARFYAGIPGYTDLSELTRSSTSMVSPTKPLNFKFIVGKWFSYPRLFGNSDRQRVMLSEKASVDVVYQRPVDWTKSSSTVQHETPNLFNPFWTANLSEYTWW